MSRVVVLGAGISGHTAASFLRKWLPRGDDVVVISPKADYNWIPSNIWVGVGLMHHATSCFLSPRCPSGIASSSSRRGPSNCIPRRSRRQHAVRRR